ncbi:MAG: hypothetical protein ACKO34_06085 [Vampirovibrionales bacterium]
MSSVIMGCFENIVTSLVFCMPPMFMMMPMMMGMMMMMIMPWSLGSLNLSLKPVTM